MMRKFVVIGLIAVLSLTMLAFLAGCGGDENKDEAKGYMSAGDGYMDAVEMNWTTLDEVQADMATVLMDGAALTPEELEAMGQEYEDLFAGMAENLDAAEAEYRKILALDGVQDYKDYANKMIEAIEVYRNALQAAVALAETAGAMLESGASMEDLMGMMQSEEFIAVGDLRDDADALVEEAEQIKRENNLAD